MYLDIVYRGLPRYLSLAPSTNVGNLVKSPYLHDGLVLFFGFLSLTHSVGAS